MRRGLSIGVLKISAENGSSDEELNGKLLALAKDRGLKSVYFVKTMGGEMTPRLLYRVSADGKRELVRGAVLDDIDQRALRSSTVGRGQGSVCRQLLWRCAADGSGSGDAAGRCNGAPGQ